MDLYRKQLTLKRKKKQLFFLKLYDLHIHRISTNILKEGVDVAGWVIWLLLAGGLFIAEMLTLTFYLLWLGIGAIVGAGVALFVPNLWVQVVCASIVSLILIAFSKPIVRKLRIGKGYEDAVDTIVGKTGIVIQDITEEMNGIVKIGGDAWSATASEAIAQGEKVVIVKRRNTVLVVRKIS